MDKTSYSPLTLNEDWPTLDRLLFMVFFACFGTIHAIFFVTSFFIEPRLMKRENIYLACSGIADLMITGAIMLTSSAIILSGEWDTVYVCKFLQFLGITSTYCYCMFFMFVAVNTYYKYCRSPEDHEWFKSIGIDCVSIMVFIFSALLSATGVCLELDYDYCERKHRGNFVFRITTSVAFHVIPGLITVICFLCASNGVQRHFRNSIINRRSGLLEHDYSMLVMNIFAYLLYFAFWVPYIVIVYNFPRTPGNKYYSVVWIGLFRSVIIYFIYGSVNSSFRYSFGYLYSYVFCKRREGYFERRHRRAANRGIPMILNQIHTTTPQRIAIQETAL